MREIFYYDFSHTPSLAQPTIEYMDDINSAISQIENNLFINNNSLRLSVAIQKFIIPEEILSRIIKTFNQEICSFQPLSEQFVKNNISMLSIKHLLYNKNIPEEIKTYIRMFI